MSAVSAWEIALFVDTGRIDLYCPVEAWMELFLERQASKRSRSDIGPPLAAIGSIISTIATRPTGF